MLNNARSIFVSYLYSNYDPIPPRTKAPEIGEEIGKATWSIISEKTDLLFDLWISTCKRLAAEVLKDPPDKDQDLQSAFEFYGTPENEQRVINQIGHRRMESPDDGSMVDLVSPNETSSDELFRLADKLDSYGNQCIERAKYIRRLAKLRQSRGL
jgi:hypothetical protein